MPSQIVNKRLARLEDELLDDGPGEDIEYYSPAYDYTFHFRFTPEQWTNMQAHIERIYGNPGQTN